MSGWREQGQLAAAAGGLRLCPVGCQNAATDRDLGFYAARWYSLMRPPRTGGARSAPGRGRRRIRRGRSGRSWRVRRGCCLLWSGHTPAGTDRGRRSLKISIRSVPSVRPARTSRAAWASARGLRGGFSASPPALAGSSQASNQVKVLVAGFHGRCPCLSAVSPTRPGERTDIWRTGPGVKADFG
jgi:hypothetical protein